MGLAGDLIGGGRWFWLKGEGKLEVFVAGKLGLGRGRGLTAAVERWRVSCIVACYIVAVEFYESMATMSILEMGHSPLKRPHKGEGYPHLYRLDWIITKSDVGQN